MALHSPATCCLAQPGFADAAHGLARLGFGDELLTAATTLSKNDLDVFLIGWRCRLRDELSKNTHGYLAHRQAYLALKISASFPDRDILKKYTHPMTSSSHSGGFPDTSSWKICEPVIHKLAEFCTTHLRWVQPGIDIRKRFDSKLWEGVFTRMLFSVSFESISMDRILIVHLMKWISRQS